MKTFLAVLLLSTSAQAADYGAFLASHYAASQGRMDLAANQILTALSADPANVELQKDAFSLALLAGRPEVDSLAGDLAENPLAQLVSAGAQVRAGHWDRAELAFAELPHESLVDVVRPVLLAWAQQAQGLTDKALTTLQDAINNGHMSSFYTLHAALIADAAHRDGMADRLYVDLAKDLGDPNVRTAQIIASWQARSGHLEQARATIGALVAAIPELAIAKPALLAGIAAPQVPDAQAGIAEAYTGMAGALRQEKQGELPPMLLQLALRLQPDFTEAFLVDAELAAAHGQWGQAAASLGRVPDQDPLAPVIRLHEASYLARSGQPARAEALLDALSRAYPDRPEPPSQLGDIFADEKRYGDAIVAYDHAIAALAGPVKSDWSLFYARGAAEERAHDWPRAEADMKQALALSPDQPAALNFLGFSWTEQNRNLTEAHSMIRRALDQRPNDGAIVDSMGWVSLRQGDVAGAIRLLEHAAELSPMDPTITGHLGDAYWDAGRHLEAQDQWRCALALKPEPADAERIEARLKHIGAQ